MTNTQLYLAIGVPMLVNLSLITFLYLALSRQIDLVKALIESNTTQLKELWRSELYRVEQVLDARLKHIEEAR